MKNSQVEEILRFYKRIDLDIRTDQKILEDLEMVYDTRGAINYDGMPHGSNTSDATAKVAIAAANAGRLEECEKLRGEIAELKRVKVEIFKEISSLTPIHKAIIHGFYIEGEKWERIAERISYSVRQSKNIRCVALKSLGDKMERNRTISHSSIIQKLIE